jgi:hypothetical protein
MLRSPRLIRPPAGTVPAGPFAAYLLRARLRGVLLDLGFDVASHLADRETRLLLARWVFDEGLQKGRGAYADIKNQIAILRQPIVVLVGDNVGALNPRHAQTDDTGASSAQCLFDPMWNVPPGIQIIFAGADCSGRPNATPLSPTAASPHTSSASREMTSSVIQNRLTIATRSVSFRWSLCTAPNDGGMSIAHWRHGAGNDPFAAPGYEPGHGDFPHPALGQDITPLSRETLRQSPEPPNEP